MPAITTEQFKELIKNTRNTYFDTPFGLAYKAFCDLGFNSQSKDYFFNHASEYIMAMRDKCWEEFTPIEKEFTTQMLSKLIDEDAVSKMTPIQAIEDFTMTYPQHIYDLSLSNTQSRRSRAGKEFEAILELMLIGAEIPTDTQGAIGKSYFQEHQIGKLVDFVTPSCVHYLINKRHSMLISAKTTLRERWQEVPEEVNRTGIREMYLATLDDSFSTDTLEILYEANVIVVTTKMIKESRYNDSTRVISFEEMLKTASSTVEAWNNANYSEENKQIMIEHLNTQISKYSAYPYVLDYYQSRLDSLT